MSFKTLAKSVLPKTFINWYRAQHAYAGIEKFRFEPNEASDIWRDIEQNYDFDSDLLCSFAYNKGAIVHKWHHYIPLYDRYFSRFRGQKLRFLEIGVSEGGSLQMWRNYFGDDAVIFGIDIDPKCKSLDGLAGEVRIGSQTDHVFLESVVDEMGGVDIVLDDGSHQMQHIKAALECLFPKLNYGGIYMVEDLHTAYWKQYGGGYRSKQNFFRYASGVIADMHHWYHREKLNHASVSKECSGIHIHDSLLVLEKNRTHIPVHSRVGERAQ